MTAFRLAFELMGPRASATDEQLRFTVICRSVHSRGLARPVQLEHAYQLAVPCFTWNSRGERGREQLIDELQAAAAKKHRRCANEHLKKLRAVRKAELEGLCKPFFDRYTRGSPWD